MFESADTTMNSKSSFVADRPPVSVLRDFFNFIRKNAEIITNNWNAVECDPSTLSTTSANPDITLTVNTAIKYKYDPRISFILILPTRMERCHFTGRNVPPAAVFTREVILVYGFFGNIKRRSLIMKITPDKVSSGFESNTSSFDFHQFLI
jgi:hypothetical protein